MMRNIYDIFRYETINTVMHRIDPRGKLVVMIGYMILAILLSSIESLVTVFIPVILQLYIARSLRKLLRGIIALTPFIIFILILNYLSMGNLYNSIVPVLRFLLFIAIVDLFFLTTNPDDFALTLEALHLPLTISLSFALALRFIPTMAQQVSEIVEAQLSRGLKLDQGNLISRVKRYLPILIPVIILSIKRSIEVAESLEIRGVDPEAPRTPYSTLKFSRKDYLYIVINLLTILAIYIATQYIINIFLL
jgi:energy-coupling factor transport system permease protein